MTKIYPNAASSSSSPSPLSSSDDCKIGGDDPVVLTVWKKSLLLNCEGFTVFDPRGNLVYRVDNYMAAAKGHIFLMDASGATLLTIRRKKLSLGDTWLIFDGETAENPRYTVRKNVSLLNSRCLAHVFQKKSVPIYLIEGSYARRCCSVYDEKRRRVAEIKQKEASVTGVAFGKDVFRLEVQPGFDAAVAMGMVILLDQMYGSGRFI
ncbi:protein LURP-one-related 8 [Salvia miltiorrhiza]|uniref:protein LURP-one-related 8 n=1 Tax=Salvia miltiorrhiza TaxID=226208 RepID=UPI0025AD0CB0|nr:protein LURP-one-related 8 [Salvia miltiorrhiza]